MATVPIREKHGRRETVTEREMGKDEESCGEEKKKKKTKKSRER